MCGTVPAGLPYLVMGGVPAGLPYLVMGGVPAGRLCPRDDFLTHSAPPRGFPRSAAARRARRQACRFPRGEATRSCPMPALGLAVDPTPAATHAPDALADPPASDGAVAENAGALADGVCGGLPADAAASRT